MPVYPGTVEHHGRGEMLKTLCPAGPPAQWKTRHPGNHGPSRSVSGLADPRLIIKAGMRNCFRAQPRRLDRQFHRARRCGPPIHRLISDVY